MMDPNDDDNYNHATHQRCGSCDWLWPRDFVAWPDPKDRGLPRKCPQCAGSFARCDMRRITRPSGPCESGNNMEYTPTESGANDDDPEWLDASVDGMSSIMGGDDDVADEAGLPQAEVLGLVPRKRRATPAAPGERRLRPSRANAAPKDSWKSAMVQREVVIDHDRPVSKTEGGAQYSQIVTNMKRPMDDTDIVYYHDFLMHRCNLAAEYGPNLAGMGGYECNNSKINSHHCQALFIGVYSDARLGGTLVQVGPGDTLPKWAERQKIGKVNDGRFHKNSLRAGYFCGDGHPDDPEDDPAVVPPCKSRADFTPENRDAALEYLKKGPALAIAKQAKPKVKSIDSYQQGNAAQKEAMVRTACNNEMVGWNNYVPLVADPEREKYLRELAVVELWALGPPIKVDDDLTEADQQQIAEVLALVEKHSAAYKAAKQEARVYADAIAALRAKAKGKGKRKHSAASASEPSEPSEASDSE